MARMVYFPTRMGLSPRPLDAYDVACQRLYRAVTAGNSQLRIECEHVLRQHYGSDNSQLDCDFSHGRNLERVYRIVEK